MTVHFSARVLSFLLATACLWGGASVALAQGTDTDGDGFPDVSDNCPLVANPSQADCNGDGVGDACTPGNDCNLNGIPDSCDIASGYATDCDGNSVPDACQICAAAEDEDGDGYLDSCEFAVGNFDLDGDVDGFDLGFLLTQWDQVNPPFGDINHDGMVNGMDLATMLGAWGPVTYSSPPGPAWATVLEWCPDPAVVTNATLRAAISAMGLPWHVRDNASNIEMRLVPPGTFMMGKSPGDPAAQSDESPQHQVTLTSAFYMGRTEVTQAQWLAEMGSNPSSFVAANGYPGSMDRPVESVPWNTIQPFLTQNGLRLPTEAEWEYACRAGTTTPRYGVLNDIAWNGGNNNPYGTKPVATKFPNAFGLYDTLGNVWEWNQDWYGSYSAAAVTNPTGPASGSYRLLRGGAWSSGPSVCRASQRNHLYPPLSANRSIGLRVARTP